MKRPEEWPLVQRVERWEVVGINKVFNSFREANERAVIEHLKDNYEQYRMGVCSHDLVVSQDLEGIKEVTFDCMLSWIKKDPEKAQKIFDLLMCAAKGEGIEDKLGESDG